MSLIYVAMMLLCVVTWAIVKKKEQAYNRRMKISTEQKFDFALYFYFVF